EELREHAVRVEVLLGDPPCSASVTLVVGTQLVDGGERLVDRREGEQPFAGRKELAEARLVSEHRPARGEVAGASIAEPTRARRDVAGLGDPELRLRTADEAPVPLGRARNRTRVAQTPAMALERFEIAMLVGIDREPEENRLVGARGKLDQLSERVGLLAVENAVTPDRAVAAPVRDGRQRVELDPLRRSPFAEHDRREGRD